MKLKNVKVGTNVRLKNDVDRLKKGQRGVIIEDDNDCPYVYWLDWYHGHNINSLIAERLKLPKCNQNVWAVPCEYLKIDKSGDL